MGIAGIGILVILIAISIGAAVIIPVETFQQWNNPQNWIFYPKTAIPSWINLFMFEKIPEHKILDEPNGSTIKLLSASLPNTDDIVLHNEKIFSTDGTIKKNLFLQSDKFDFSIEGFSAEDIVFSKSTDNVVLKGDYVFLVNLYGVQKENSIVDSTLIVGGKAFGIMGTDELRRDLAVGILWGTPLALFIGIAVAIGSVVMGLVYGVYAGFKGKLTDESMMRFNDIIYALPVLPFLII